MRMLSGRMHGLMFGLALAMSVQGLATKSSFGQYPGMSQAGGMMNQDMPTSMAFPGPPPMDVVYAGANSGGSCDSGSCGCGDPSCSSGGPLSQMMGRGGCGACGGAGCGACGGGAFGGGCPACGGAGCGACGGGGGCGALFDGRLVGMMGILAPYSEGGKATERWFDFYAGTIGLQRSGSIGGFETGFQDPVTGQFAKSSLVTTDGISGTPVLSTQDLDVNNMQFGLELIAALQTGPGASIEARYFGLNQWETSAQASTVASGNPTLFSVFSLYGTSPNNGFDDTDRSFIQSLNYQSEIHNGEVNYRRRIVPYADCLQGSWLAGVRYFDLDERMGFQAVGSNDNTFTFNQLRFSNIDVTTRNQLTGFQLGGDLWLNVMPGLKFGVEGKGGVYGNHHEVQTSVVANSVAQAGEFLQAGRTAYLSELSTSVLYRLSYSWTLRSSYTMMYVDNVAIAPENLNTRGLSSVLGGGTFGADRNPVIDADAEIFYYGFSLGGEYTW